MTLTVLSNVCHNMWCKLISYSFLVSCSLTEACLFQCRLKPHLSMHLGRVLGLSMQLGKILIPELDLGWPLVSQFQQLQEPPKSGSHMEATQHEEDPQD